MADLEGQVALVTGATRGAGRGIAVELGAAGAIVYCTGRSTRAHRSAYGRPETIEETADLVTAAGGTGLAVAVDHLDAEQVAALVARIDREQNGRLDVLVNNVWGGQGELTDNLHRPFWEHKLGASLKILHNAVDTHIITAWHAAPLMVAHGRGLIVGITDGSPHEYHANLFYDLPKKSVMRLAVAYAEELGPHGVTSVAISPGWLRSEMQLEQLEVTEDDWQDAYWRDPEHVPATWLASESPRYTGRAVTALATDPDMARWNGQTTRTRTLAETYELVDVDGTTPGHGIYAWDHLRQNTPRRENYHQY